MPFDHVLALDPGFDFDYGLGFDFDFDFESGPDPGSGSGVDADVGFAKHLHQTVQQMPRDCVVVSFES